MKWIRWAAAALFMVFGVASLIDGLTRI
jgi:hypothetical protein